MKKIKVYHRQSRLEQFRPILITLFITAHRSSQLSAAICQFERRTVSSIISRQQEVGTVPAPYFRASILISDNMTEIVFHNTCALDLTTIIYQSF